jgi:prolycopene isomerase
MKLFRKEYDTNYDVIIIGAGIGGLICANLLGEEGLKVLVVEQHYVVGGYCSSFKRRNFTFDSATHFYPLLGNKTTMTGKLLQKLEIPTEWIKIDPVDQFHFPGGETFVVPAEFKTYLKELKSKFPGQEENIDNFFGEVREAYLYGLLYYFKDIPNRKAEEYGRYTVLEKLEEHFDDPRLRAHLIADHSHWGSLPSRTSFLFDAMLRLAYFLGNYYPKGSSQAFADDLAAGIERRGGHILTYTDVEKILVEDGKAAGIVGCTRSQRKPQRVTFRAPVVVSNADIRQTYERLIEEKYRDPSIMTRIGEMRPSLSCYLLHMGLKGMDHKKMEEIEGYHWFSWDPEDLKRTFFKVFFTSLLDPGVAPPGHDVLIIQKWQALDYESVVDWTQVKEEVEGHVLGKLREMVPGFDDHIVVKMSASALTSYRYTLNFQGSMLGWEMSPDQLGSNRPANTTPIENLYLVGHWTKPGGGITPVIVSAQRVADLILSGRTREDSIETVSN